MSDDRQDPTIARVKDLEQALAGHKHMLGRAHKEREALRADLLRVTEERTEARAARRALEFELGLVRDGGTQVVEDLKRVAEALDAAEVPREALVGGARLTLAERVRLLDCRVEVAELRRAVDAAMVDHSKIEAERARLAREVEALRKERDEAQRKLGWMEAAHHLLANEEAFISPAGRSPFFASAEVSTEGLPMLSLNMGDTFYFACADCEPFSYEDAQKLLAIAKEQGWPGLVRWASEQRASRGEPSTPIRPVEERIDRAKQTAAERDALKAQLAALTAEHDDAAKAAEEREQSLSLVARAAIACADERFQTELREALAEALEVTP